MAYFNLKCLDPAIGKYIIIALNAVVAIMGVIHFAYAGVVQNYKSSATSSSPNQSISVLSDSHSAYYVITGVIMFLVSALLVLLVLEKLGTENPYQWVRIILVLLIIEFGFNFFIAVEMSMFTNYWNVAYKTSIDQAKQIMENDSYGDVYKTPARALLNWIRFSAAEAVITWIITLPCISVIMVSFFSQILTEENANKLTPGNIQPVKPTQVNPVPQSSIVSIQ